MTRDETVALFLECEAKRAAARATALAGGKSEIDAKTEAHAAAKAHWNAWAESLLAERKAMEADGRWAADKLLAERKALMEAGLWPEKQDFLGDLEPKNAETRAWMEKAAADFSCLRFEAPGDDASVTNEPAVKSIQLEEDNADFGDFLFPGYASFEGATFKAHPHFASATFTGDASFERAIFIGEVQFGNTAFKGCAYFGRATFTSNALFVSATFTDDTRFARTCFTGHASFACATFAGDASFYGATFAADACFDSATFTGGIRFNSATFTCFAAFRCTTFIGIASFESTTFTGDASLYSATFNGAAWFGRTLFTGAAYFESAIFTGPARFTSATFQGSAAFSAAKFLNEASFAGIKVERAFDMTGAAFAQVPAFNQADFKQAPDLDDVEFPLPGYWRRGDPKLITHYRAIRRMAIQGADYEREQMAFKGETRSKRGTEHKPWHPAFWFGIAYDALSDYGRSIARPLLIWLASGLAFAAIYAWNAGVAVSGWGAACADDGASKALKALTLSAANSLPLIGSSRGEVAQEFYAKCLALPHAPAWSPILQMAETLWSTVLIFLFLLALRNQFKIK